MTTAAPHPNPGAGSGDWRRQLPAEVTAVFERAITVEFATLTRTGAPVTVPTTPYLGEDGRTLDVSTGLTYPAKAERARRDPRVCLLFADPVGSGTVGSGTGTRTPPVVMVQGLATVRDADLQANTDRYVLVSQEKLPEATKTVPKSVMRRMAWYYARIWVQVTPLHIRWWPGRELVGSSGAWDAPDAAAALSDPAPSGAQPGPWKKAPADWRPVVADALQRLPMHDLTVVGDNGFPLCLPVAATTRDGEALTLRLGPGAPPVAEGPACLTLHAHAETFIGQENRTVVGTVTSRPGAVDFEVERALAGWSIVGGTARRGAGLMLSGMRLRRRLETEARRRFQPVPEVRLPTRP